MLGIYIFKSHIKILEIHHKIANISYIEIEFLIQFVVYA